MKKLLLLLNCLIIWLLFLLPIYSVGQSHCLIDELNRLDVYYDSPCEGDAALIDAIRFNINVGSMSWFRVGAPMPSSAFVFFDQLYIIPYNNQDQGVYAGVFTDQATGCTDTLFVQLDSLIPGVKPDIFWVQDICGAVKMKAVNLNDTSAINNTYAWMDQNSNFSIFSQIITTSSLTETVRITNSVGCYADNTEYMPTSSLQIPSGNTVINVIGGSNVICPGNSRIYYVSAQAGITYNWSVPSGATIVSGQGTSTINVNYTTAFSGGLVAITKSNECGSVSKSLTVTKGVLPARPSAISGTASGLCGAANIGYSVTNVAGITYNWNIPSGSTIVSGQGTKQINVNFPSSNFSGSVTVSATNGCGTSALRSLSIKATPGTPAAINGPSIVCSASVGNIYSVTPVAAVTSYKWTGPSGSHITGNGITSTANILTTSATSVTVSFGIVTSTSTIRVLANNSCGSGSTRTKTLSPCLPRIEYNNTSASEITVYPNPTKGDVTLNFETSAEENIWIQITDLAGKKLFYKDIITKEGFNEIALPINYMHAGCYFIQLHTSQGLVTKRFIKE